MDFLNCMFNHLMVKSAIKRMLFGACSGLFKHTNFSVQARNSECYKLYDFSSKTAEIFAASLWNTERTLSKDG